MEPLPAGYGDIEFKRVGSRSLQLDIDLPRTGSGPYPVIVYLFGGGWAWGNRKNRPVVRRVDDNLLKQGYAIVAIDYRLSKEAIFPAQIEDCKAAIRWLRAHEATYPLDVDRIGIWGFSAGAHLGALLGTTGYPSVFDVGDNLEYASLVQAVCAFAVTSDFQQLTVENSYQDPDDPASVVAQLFGGPPREQSERAIQANPITHIQSGTPPFLLIHGETDPVVPVSQSELLHNALQAAHIDSTLYVIPRGDHGMGGLDETQTAQILKLTADFFHRVLA